jgi:aspartyl-tRNA(Asn)/glutamyl-tRNA(Gln) amidotransferase subunit A
MDTARVPDCDGSLRLGVAGAFFWGDTSPGVTERLHEAMALIEADGATLADVELPGVSEVYGIYKEGGIVSAELYAFLRDALPQVLLTLDPRVRRRMDDGKALEAWEYLQRKARYAALSAEAASVLGGFDAVLCPTVPLTPPPVALLEDPDTYAKLNLLNLRNTCVVSFLGLCAVSIPAGVDAEGLPVGLQLIGSPGTEPRLLALARRIERVIARADVWTPPHSLD